LDRVGVALLYDCAVGRADQNYVFCGRKMFGGGGGRDQCLLHLLDALMGDDDVHDGGAGEEAFVGEVSADDRGLLLGETELFPEFLETDPVRGRAFGGLVQGVQKAEPGLLAEAKAFEDVAGCRSPAAALGGGRHRGFVHERMIPPRAFAEQGL
jgi:hypothetical protein